MCKNLILILLLFFYVGNIEVIAQAPKLSGKIRNLTGKEIVCSYALDELISVSDTIKLSNTDTFSFTFNRIKKPTYVAVRCNRQNLTLYLAPGYDIKLFADGSRLRNTAFYSGRGVLASYYLHYVFRDSVVIKNSWRSDDRDCSNECFFSKCERYRSIKDSILRFFDSTYQPGDPYWKQFINTERINDRYVEVSGLLTFSYLNNKSAQGRLDFYAKYISPLLLPKDSLSNNLNISSVRDHYALMIFRYLQFDIDTAADRSIFDKNGIYGSYFIMASTTYAGKIKSIAAGRILDLLVSILESQSLTIYPGRFPRVDTLINQYAVFAHNKEFVQQLRERYKKVESTSKFVPKEYFANLKFEDEAGNAISLESFKDKIIYADVWAGWCGPCIEKFEMLRKLKPQLDSMGVMLVLINVDNTKAQWQQAVGRFNPPGLQLFAQGGLDGDFARKFRVQSLPRYLVFNKAGNCANQYAPEPDKASLPDELIKTK